MIGRREFVTLLGSAAAAWPVAARAQQGERTRRVGVLLPAASDDAEFQARVGAFLQGLQQSGWTIGRNVRIDTRWATTNAAEIRRHAAELAALAPDVTTRVAVLRDPVNPGGPALFGIIQTVAPSLRVEVIPINMRDAGEIERSLAAFAHSSISGLIITPNPFAWAQRDLILTLAARHKLPAIYYDRAFVHGGGMITDWPDFLDQYRRAAGYVYRILKGEKPADLPVQAPTKYELVINLKTARALGIEMPPTLLARANEVIE